MGTSKRLLAAAVLLAAALPACAGELRGAIRSATGALPSPITIAARSADGGPAITGTVEAGRYRIALPDKGMFQLRIQAPGWEAAPQNIFDVAHAVPRDFLLYPAKVPEPALAAELLDMERQDQAIREHFPDNPDKAFLARMRREDLAREKRLRAIIDRKGWPVYSMVGYRAAASAWLIAQHGTDAFLKRCLPLMQAAAAKGEMNPADLALSTDRVLVQAGKKQLYGSQLRSGPGEKAILDPIEDEIHVDERRAAAGLEPLANYLKRFNMK